MRINIRKMLAGAITAAMLCAIPFTALASTKTSVSKVSLSIDSEFELDGDSYDINIDSNSGNYSVDGYKLQSTIPSGGWQTSSHPVIIITLSLDDPDSYKWAVSSKSSVTVSGDSGTVTAVSKSGNYLHVTFKFGTLSDSSSDSDGYDLTVEDLSWDEESATAFWSGGNDAKKYEVKLYRSGNLLKTVTTTSDHYCFASSFTQSGTYRFKVRAIYSSSKKGTFETSENFTVTSTEASNIRSEYGSTSNSGEATSTSASVTSGSTSGPGGTTGGQWLRDNTGWWYRNADGSYTTNNWQYINGQWYYFLQTGYMATGWINVNGIWYYLDAVNGNMYASQMTPDGYYVTASGAWIQ